MTRQELLPQIRGYFSIDELVCNHTLQKWGESAWQFLDTDFLHALLIIRRDILRKPMWCNNHRQGVFQRGLRCNMCKLVKEKPSVYLSAHLMGKAGDFTVEGMSAEDARRLIKVNADKLPCQIRMEDGVSWLHIDCRPTDSSSEKVNLFKA